MPTRNVHLTEHLDQFISAGISSGSYSNASEVVREGLRLLERREREDQARVEWLRTAATDAFDSIDRGEGTTFDSMEELDAYVRGVGAEVFADEAVRRRA
ncbi:antitoxin ParD1/3/4 [Granulicella rosea]|uniref:Antitoxin ParD1/3/4 n=1 Tax=Granulicella rosea TaxID=474952 RepID=A0A239MIJ0_9BACT|nr:type II toxin-antitoxin system ParD family antitoxin [Granulicella rosea]SNT42043.1 antitoxin ParD1/3/4 [Granulicella rosea]